MTKNNKKTQNSQSSMQTTKLNKGSNMATGVNIASGVNNDHSNGVEQAPNHDISVNKNPSMDFMNPIMSYNGHSLEISSCNTGMQGMQNTQYMSTPPVYSKDLQDTYHQTVKRGNQNMNIEPNSLFQLMQQIQQTNNSVLSRLTSIEANVAKLAPMEQNISTLLTDVTNLKKENKQLSTKITEVEHSCETISGIFDQYLDSKSQTDRDMSDLKRENQVLLQKIEQSNENMHNLSEELLDLKARSMRENLLFFGINESRGRNGVPEDTEALLRTFLKNEVLPESQESVENINFDRVHRIGRKNPGNSKPRPIVAKFEKYTDREKIRKAGFEVNRQKNGFSVREQYPIEIEQRRKELYPIMHELKQNRENKVVLVKDKLFVNNELYRPDNNRSQVSSPLNRRYNNSQPRRQVQAQRRVNPTNSCDTNSTQNSDVSTPTRTRFETRPKQKARSPLEDEINKRSKSNTPDRNQTGGERMETTQSRTRSERDQSVNCRIGTLGRVTRAATFTGWAIL